MAGNVTTTLSGFRVEDVTFHNARKQSEIINELNYDTNEDNSEIEVPKSLTPEQVIKYFEECISVSSDIQLKRVYSHTIKWIKELEESRAKINSINSKESRKSKEVSDDI